MSFSETINSSAYEHWVFKNEEPSLSVQSSSPYSKKEKRMLFQRLEWEKKFIKQVGEEEYKKILIENEERKNRYLQNED